MCRRSTASHALGRDHDFGQYLSGLSSLWMDLMAFVAKPALFAPSADLAWMLIDTQTFWMERTTSWSVNLVAEISNDPGKSHRRILLYRFQCQLAVLEKLHERRDLFALDVVGSVVMESDPSLDDLAESPQK
jgi:hypothetical protein